MPSGALYGTGWENPSSELEILSLELRPVADALDLETLLEPLRDALDHVRDERPGEPVERTILTTVGRPGHDELAVLLIDGDALWHRLGERSQRSLDCHAAGATVTSTPLGSGIGFRPILLNSQLSFRSSTGCAHQTKQMTSPPTPSSWAWRLVTTPLDVDMIAVPIPPRTRGSRSLRA